MTKSKDPAQSTRPTRRARITRTGCIFALLSAIVCAAAFNTGVNLLYLLMATLLSALAIAYLLPAVSIRRISVQRFLPPHISAGSSFPIELSVHNGKRIVTSHFIMLEDHVARIGKGGASKGVTIHPPRKIVILSAATNLFRCQDGRFFTPPCSVQNDNRGGTELLPKGEVRNEAERVGGRSGLRSLFSFLFRRQPFGVSHRLDHAAHFRRLVERTKPGETIQRRYTICFPRRGLYKFHDLRASTKFPFGLFCGSNDLGSRTGTGENAEEAIVYPAYGKLLMGEAEVGKFDVSYTGRLLSKGYGEEEFYGLREYRPGDNPRRIHWKSSARSSKPLVKELDSNIAGEVSIFLDTYIHPKMEAQPLRHQLDRLEIAVSFAATLSKELISRGYSLSFTAYTPELTSIPSGKGTRHLFRILRELALLEPSGDKDILSFFFEDVSGQEDDISDPANGKRKEIRATLHSSAPILIVLGSHRRRRVQATIPSVSGETSYNAGRSASASTGDDLAARDEGEHEALRSEAESTLNINNRITRLHPSAKVYDVSDPRFQSVFQYETV